MTVEIKIPEEYYKKTGDRETDEMIDNANSLIDKIRESLGLEPLKKDNE